MPPKKRYRDPHADREAENYENPVPSRELILEVLNDHGKPMEFEQIASLLEVDEDGDVEVEFEGAGRWAIPVHRVRHHFSLSDPAGMQLCSPSETWKVLVSECQKCYNRTNV